MLDANCQTNLEIITNLRGGKENTLANLMDTTQEALDPKGQQGSLISNQEKQKIFKAVSEVEEKIAKLKISVK